MRIGELAQKTNVSADTLRLYEKRGLIKSDRQNNGYRDFDASMVQLVLLIKSGQKLGFKLREMDGLAKAVTGSGLSQDETSKLLGDKLSEVDAKIRELTQLRALLADMMQQACPLRAPKTKIA
ncbi:hypothetical protein NBRC116601_06910 [Cognatishimia sp. WU-CL00825]|uniref:MerR family DNA-binding transcriptional regulator n=1 Tax=Cognatishimia sp. WU-CL00825 TaxID=3127658 RepID=UPI003108C434